VPCALGGVGLLCRAVVGLLILGGGGALIKLEREAVHQLGGLVERQAAGGQVGVEEGPDGLVQPAEGVAVHAGVKDHVHQPDGLQRLPGGGGGLRRGVAQVGGHALEFGGALRGGRALRLPGAARREPLGEVDDGLAGDADGIEKGVLLGGGAGGPLGFRVGHDAAQPAAEEPRVIRHDVPEHGGDAEPLRRGGLALGVGGIVGEAVLVVEARGFQRQRAGEQLAIPERIRQAGALHSQRPGAADSQWLGHVALRDARRAHPGGVGLLHGRADARPQVGDAGRIGPGGQRGEQGGGIFPGGRGGRCFQADGGGHARAPVLAGAVWRLGRV